MKDKTVNYDGEFILFHSIIERISKFDVLLIHVFY